MQKLLDRGERFSAYALNRSINNFTLTESWDRKTMRNNEVCDMTLAQAKQLFLDNVNGLNESTGNNSLFH